MSAWMQQRRLAPRVNAIATAVPDGEVEGDFHAWAMRQLEGTRQAAMFDRMAARSGIARRYSVLKNPGSDLDADSFQERVVSPGTADRMRVYAREAPGLALRAIERLPEREGITHLVLASCTGFLAPGLDQVVARRLGLAPDIERISIGFMGCYAGITALRTAAHIVRSQPEARVLVLSVELCSLHLQSTRDLEPILAMAQFADGAAAALVTAEGPGLTLGEGISATLEESDDLITWTIGDTGFAMHLSGAVPGRFADALGEGSLRKRLGNGRAVEDIPAWAVHPGGRSVLDAVERGLGLADGLLGHSRGVLRDYGNMSSASVLFVLQRLMEDRPEAGLALAFGPGLALEGLRLGWTGDAG